MAGNEPGNVDHRYSVRDVSELLGLTPRQVRSLVAEDIVHPIRGSRGRFLFAFPDLVVMRGIADLVHAGVPMTRVRTAVHSLRDQLPDDARITEARLDASGSHVVAHLDATAWEPESGQTVLDFTGLADRRSPADVVEARPSPTPAPDSAGAWYAHADEIEDADPAGAESAYRRAIDLDPDYADAHLNLGRLLHAGGAVGEALEHYETACTLDPADATTHFNVGVAREDLGDDDAAVLAYERAIGLAPRFADARYNLSRVYERLGRSELALQHLRTYRELLAGR